MRTVTLPRVKYFFLLLSFVILDWKMNRENSMTKIKSKLLGTFLTTGWTQHLMLFFINVHRYQVVGEMGLKKGHIQLLHVFQTNGKEGHWCLCQHWNIWSHWSVSTIQQLSDINWYLNINYSTISTIWHCLGDFTWHLESGAIHITGKNIPYVFTLNIGVMQVCVVVMMQKSTKNLDTVYVLCSLTPEATTSEPTQHKRVKFCLVLL